MPLAAADAACLGAHIEASNSISQPFEYYQGKDKDKLVSSMNVMLMNVTLTNRIKEGIVLPGKSPQHLEREKKTLKK